jgi:hypothetical protein
VLPYQLEILGFLNGTPAESDKNYPSVMWTGFMKCPGQKQKRIGLTLCLIFVDGQIFGKSQFDTQLYQNHLSNMHLIQGEYNKATGKVSMLGIDRQSMPIYFEGYNENKIIYGRWAVFSSNMEFSGGFIFWTIGSADPTRVKNRLI